MQPEGIIYDKDASELWAIYGNGTRLLCEMQKKYIMRPKPEVVVKEVKKVEKLVEEEDTSKKDKKAKKGKGKKGKEESEEEEEEEEEIIIPPDEYDVEQAACFSLSMENGHILKFLPNGDVMQKKVQSKKCNLLYEDYDNPE